MKNLKKTINFMNKNFTFNFKLRIDGKNIYLYDENESYHIGYLEEQNCLIRSIEEEFGVELGECNKDKIMEELLKAVKKDFGEDAYIEWENNVVMMIAR